MEIVTRYKLGVGSNGYVFSGKETCDVIFDTKKRQYTIVDGIEKSLSYIVDKHIREVIKHRLNSAFPNGETYLTEAEKAKAEGRLYNGKENCQKALDQLKNLNVKPLYSDKNKNIIIRSVRCKTGLTAVQPLRFNSNKEPISFVLTKNNHHVAIYADEKGQYREAIYTFWQVVERSKYQLPLIIKNPQELWNIIATREKNGELFPESLIQSLPSPSWTFIESLQLNDMFIIGLTDTEYEELLFSNNYQELGERLYRVQNISTNDYFLRLHTDTTTDRGQARLTKKFLRKGLISFISSNPHKVDISLLGELVNRSL